MDKVKNVPDIRFEGFENEWEDTSLGMVASEYGYGLCVESKKFDGLNKYLRITDIDDRSRKFSKLDLKSPKFRGKTNNRYILNEGDIVFARTGASTGKTYLYDKQDGIVYFAGFLVRAKVNRNNSSQFVFYKTLSNDFNKFIKDTSQRSGQPGINAEEYKSFIFKKTSFNEQTKIGDFFKNLDEKLELEKEKHQKLVNFKKAMLDDMFPKEGEKVPKVRFEGFDDEWSTDQLRNILSYSNGMSYENEVCTNGRYELINLNSVSIDGGLKLSGKYIDNTFKTLSKNDLVMILSDVAHGNLLGRVALIPENNKYVLNQRVASLSLISNHNPHFLLYFINSKQQYFKKKGAGSSQLNISRNTVEKFLINFPTLEEQILIGNFFKNLDEKIEISEKRIGKIENFKKAMLDKMFV